MPELIKPHPQLEIALAGHPDWPLPLAQPLVIEQLANGPSHCSYLLQYGIYRLVLRLNQTGALLKTPLVIEQQIHQVAAQKRITPKLLYLDSQHRWQLREYIGSDTNAVNALPDLSKLVQLVKSIHQLPSVDFQINLSEVITYYLLMLEKIGFSLLPKVKPYFHPVKLLLDLVSSSHDHCLCHNDLHPGNFIQSPRGLMVIDWEYAGMNHPYFDLAGLAQGRGLNVQQQLRLLDLYQGQSSRADLLKLQKFIAIYGYCCLLWYGLQVATTKEETHLAEFSRLLEKLPGLIKQAQAK